MHKDSPVCTHKKAVKVLRTTKNSRYFDAKMCSNLTLVDVDTPSFFYPHLHKAWNCTVQSRLAFYMCAYDIENTHNAIGWYLKSKLTSSRANAGSGGSLYNV